jgi:large subunit ribosomal protein L24
MSNKRFEPKFNIKKGDNVIIIAGDDKGKTGKVTSVLHSKSRVFVEGINIISKHQKPDAKNPDGGIIKKEASVHISNVSLIDPKTGKATRVKTEKKDGKTVRISKKTQEVI